MAEPLRVLAVGAGYFASFHHAGWAALPGATLAGVVDPDTARARGAAERAGCPAFATLDEALAAVAVDLVDIATPPATHLALIERATAAGKVVICQKPFCGTLEAARQAVALAEARGAMLVVHENFRFQPWWRALKAALEAGRIGDPYQVTFRLRPGDGQGPRAYLDRQPYFQTMPRLLVHETAVHFVDVFRFLMGDADWVWADLRRLNPVIAGEDAGLIVFGWADGRRAVFDGNRLADHAATDRRRTMGEALAEGSAGVIELDGEGRLWHRALGATERSAIPVVAGEGFGGGCVAALQAHVLEALASGATPENTGRDYLRVMEIVEAVYASAESGARVNLRPPERDGGADA